MLVQLETLAMPDYVPPSPGADAFHCAHCEAYAHQSWQDLDWYVRRRGGRHQILDGVKGKCSHCNGYTVWAGNEMVYPGASPAPLPTDDMPEDVREDYNEARQVVNDSPRAAAALLRLAMEKLARELTGDENRSLNNMIGDLVEDGEIDERVQMALDSVRVVGNESVHPGKLDMRDDRDTALRLFDLVNDVVEITIARENRIKSAYGDIPEETKEWIENRDGV